MSAFPAWSSLPVWRVDMRNMTEREESSIVSALSGPLLSGHCVLCACTRNFEPDAALLGMREGLACVHCRCNARQRAAAAVLLEALESPASARVYLSEQASPFYVALRRRIGRLIGSEYRLDRSKRLRLTLWLLRQGVRAWLRKEDITALRLKDATLDGVVSLDVLEHVPQYLTALREFARVLRSGGVLVLTVPFYDDQDDNVPVAWVGDSGAIEHTGEPEYHGDPLGGGVLCFHHFGWRLLQDLREAGFERVEACRVYDAALGLPQGQWVIRAWR